MHSYFYMHLKQRTLEVFTNRIVYYLNDFKSPHNFKYVYLFLFYYQPVDSSCHSFIGVRETWQF